MNTEFINVVGVKFRQAGRIYYYNSQGFELFTGDKVIANTPKGLGMGEVVIPPTMVPKDKAFSYNVLRKETDTDYFLANLSPATLDGSIDSEPKVPEQLDRIIRKANKEDHEAIEKNKILAEKAHSICLDKIKSRNLSMKLVSTEYAHNGKKVVFYFTSNGRVDFRELVKELLKDLKVRIELRQIDVRDETKLIGGAGCCGRELCCKTFLTQFKPVSIKMAKEQNLALNPTKVSGICGRLLCCLTYEIDTYTRLREGMPKSGTSVETPEGMGRIIKINVFNKKIDVLLESDDYKQFDLDEIKEAKTNSKVEIDKSKLLVEADLVSEEDMKDMEDTEIKDIKETFLKQVGDGTNKPKRNFNNNKNNKYNSDNKNRNKKFNNRSNRDRGSKS